jgi:hypothetical protein
MLAGYLYHPSIPYIPSPTAVAAAATADTTRWAVAHLAVGVGSGLLLIAFLAIRGYLGEASEGLWSPVSLPLIVMGTTLYTLLPGMEFAVLAAVETGGNAQATQIVLTRWFVPILLSGATAFALGVLGLARGIARSGILTPRWTTIVFTAFAAMAVSRFVPLGIVQFYFAGIAGVVALWPIAHVMWRRTEQPRQEPQSANPVLA